MTRGSVSRRQGAGAEDVNGGASASGARRGGARGQSAAGGRGRGGRVGGSGGGGPADEDGDGAPTRKKRSSAGKQSVGGEGAGGGALVSPFSKKVNDDGAGISAGGAEASATDKDGSHLVSPGLALDQSDRVGHDDDATRDAEGGVDQDSCGAGVAVAGRTPSAPASAVAAVRPVPAAPGSRPAVVPVLGRAAYGSASSFAPPVGVSGGPCGSAAAVSSVAPPVGVSGGPGGSAAAASSVAPPLGVSGGAGGSAAPAEPVADFHGRRLHGPQSSYGKGFVQLPLKDIKVPMALTRVRREPDVETFSATFRATGYDWSRGLMTGDAALQIVNIFHLLGALRRLVQEGHSNAPETVYVCRVTRRDGKLLTRSDTLALGLSANKDRRRASR